MIKQRSQANHKSSLHNFKQTYTTYGFKGKWEPKKKFRFLKHYLLMNFHYHHHPNFWTGFYRGYFTTVLREIPFSFIQYPLWEFLKRKTCELRKCQTISTGDSLICGAVAGAFAGLSTTPFDVAKTRIILAEKSDQASKGNLFYVWKEVYSKNGLKG